MPGIHPEVYVPSILQSFVLLTRQTSVYVMLIALISTASSACDLPVHAECTQTASFYTVYPGSLSTSAWAASGSTPSQARSSLLPSHAEKAAVLSMAGAGQRSRNCAEGNPRSERSLE